jgi:hypothetical protein
VSGEESSKLDEQAPDHEEDERGKEGYASVEGFLKMPLIGGLLVPSVPSSNGGAATESAKADRA